MLEQSSTVRTYTRDAYAPVRRDAHAEVEKLTAGSIRAPFHFSNFEESVLAGWRSTGNIAETAVAMRAFLRIMNPGLSSLEFAREWA